MLGKIRTLNPPIRSLVLYRHRHKLAIQHVVSSTLDHCVPGRRRHVDLFHLISLTQAMVYYALSIWPLLPIVLLSVCVFRDPLQFPVIALWSNHIQPHLDRSHVVWPQTLLIIR